MPSKTTMKRARKASREGKRPTTVAGEFVREEIEHVRQGKHGARSPQQAIAIGLSKARRAGVRLPPPKRGRAKPQTIKSAQSAARAGRTGAKPRSTRRARAASRALKREPRSTASRRALSRQARAAAQRRRTRGAATPGARGLPRKPATGAVGKQRKRRRTAR